MVLLRILSGTRAGAEVVARHFPFRIGRSTAADWRLEAGGVWEDHCHLERDPGGLIGLLAVTDALVLVNGHPVQRTRLRQGDVIELGAVKLQFGLSPVIQRSLRLRAALTWTLLASLVVAQLLLLVWLTR